MLLYNSPPLPGPLVSQAGSSKKASSNYNPYSGSKYDLHKTSTSGLLGPYFSSNNAAQIFMSDTGHF